MSTSRRTRGLWLSALVIAAAGALLIPTSIAAFTDQATADGTWSTGRWSQQFSFQGQSEPFEVPEASSVTIKAWGGDGGSTANASGGQGGYAEATFLVGDRSTADGFRLHAGEELAVLVGGDPGQCGDAASPCWPDGPNAGGAGGEGDGAAGGGASAVLLGSGADSSLLLAAGGGGGASSAPGGAGGGNGGADGGGGSNKNWGSGGDPEPSLGTGTDGQKDKSGKSTGGGGGGGGSGPGEGGKKDSGGGGGSGWILDGGSWSPGASPDSGHGQVLISWE